MRRRGRVRRVGKWIGTLAGLLILLTALAGLKWHNVSFGNQGRFLTAAGGAVELVWSAARGRNPRFMVGKPHASWQAVFALWSSYALWPHNYRSSSGTVIVSVPLWILFLLASAPTALLWYLDRRRFPPGHCERCGYDLTGNTSGRCSECGTPTSQSDTR
jgi:hypothetical protein